MMKSLLALGVLAAPLSAQTSVTIYNDGRVLVRREVAVAVPKGSSSHKVSLGPLDPASLFPLDSGVAITRASYDGATDEGSALRRSVGRRIVFRLPESKDTLSAVVLGVDPLRLQLPDGRITFQPPGAAMYPAEVVVADPSAAIDLFSTRERKTLRLGYFTGGATWQASYQVTIGGRTARVAGLAVLESQGLRAEKADMQLLAGSVGRADKAPEPPRPMERRLEAAYAMADQAASEQRVGEFHLYTLPGKSTLLPGLTTSVALFEPADGTVRADVRGAWAGAVLGHPPAGGRGERGAGRGELYPQASPQDRVRRSAAARWRRPDLSARQRGPPATRGRGLDGAHSRRGATSGSPPGSPSISPRGGCRPATSPAATAPPLRAYGRLPPPTTA